MSKKPITPYQRLLDDVRRFMSDFRHPTRKRLWSYPKDRLGEPWGLSDLYERAAAADLLGYDTVLKADEAEGLVVEFRKRPNEGLLPWSLR